MAWVAVGTAGASVGLQLYGMKKSGDMAAEEKKHLKAQGKGQQKAKYFAAKQMEIAAKQEQAVGSINAQEEMRKTALLQSRALAIAGASGAGADDPNISRLLSDFAVEGQLAAATHLYNADEAARNLRVGAKVARWEGDQAKKGLNIQAGAVNEALKLQRIQTATSILDTVGQTYRALPKTTT